VTTIDVVVRPAHENEASTVAWLAALTFPLACPPGTPVATMAAHIAARLSPPLFRAWARSPRHELLVAEAPAGGADMDVDTPGFRAEPRPGLVGYALLVAGEPDGEAERSVVHGAVGPVPLVELSKIYVHPDHLGTATAGTLMAEAVMSAARLSPGARLWLGTNSDNARAQAFYRKHGFEVVGHRTYDVGGVQHDDVVMLHTAG
jgi:ribosomal protein S18 acetylase RimI-like enzyme